MHRHSAFLSATAIVVLVAVVQGIQTAPSQPSRPIRDPGTGTPAAPVGSASVSGTVVLAGVPARRARVTLSGADAGPARTVFTNEQGRFVFSALPAGRYSLSASKPGHIAALFGQLRPGRPGTPIQLADGQEFDTRLQLTRGGVLTGTILDENGEAIPGTQVRALRYVFQNGQRSLQQAGNGSTDDRGIYRIFGLQPGDYVVGATPRNVDGPPNIATLRAEMDAVRQRAESVGRTGGNTEARAGALAARLASMESVAGTLQEEPVTGYAPVYYPGATALSQAAPIAIAPGEERGGLDFQLQRVPVARIDGLIANPTGVPVQNVQVTLVDLSQIVPGLGNNSTRADNDGRFRFTNVAPGQYRIAARAVVAGERGGRGDTPIAARGRAMTTTPADQVRLWGTADVTVDGRDLTNVALALQPGMSASGRLVFQGTSQPPADLTRLRVSLNPADPGSSQEVAGPAAGRADASGKFTINGIAPGRYRLTASGAQAWTLESAVVDGQDSLDFPFEVKAGQNIGSAVITFTDQRTELSGGLTDSRGQPEPGYTLLVYSADRQHWIPQSRRIRTTRPATDGTFSFAGLPPGDYRIAPIVDVEPGAWFDPAFLQELDSTSLRISLAEGERKVQNVRLAGG